MKKPRKKIIPVLGGALEITVNIAGKGKPLLYLHSAGGYYWDDFLDGLADHYKVYAPHFPGTAPGRPNEIDKVDNLWDVVTAYDDLLDGLGLKKIRLMGHSFGGLLAAELAAHRPKAIEKLVLIAPIGLWRDDAPYSTANWCALDGNEIMDALFYDKNHPYVVKRMTPPSIGKNAAELWQVDFIWTLGCTAKVIWPIPDKGLRKRIHRVSAPSLVVWGENDKLIPTTYAQEFGKALNAEVVMLPKCGHEPPLEQCEMLTAKVRAFMG